MFKDRSLTDPTGSFVPHAKETIMHHHSSVLLPLVLFVAVTSALAQEQPSFPGPEKEHQWLQKFVGDWDTESKGMMGPDQPPVECAGTLTSRTLGGFWVVNEMKGDVMGAPMTGIQTIGYDAAKKKYVGTWVDSMTSYMWQYEGQVDNTGKILTLEAEGPNFSADGKLATFHDVYEFTSDDEIVITSKMLGDDGKWITFMTGTAKRKK
jgi:hypothetical protein